MRETKALIIATAGLTTNLLNETLTSMGVSTQLILEEKETKKAIIKRRLKKLGFFKTTGQLMFLAFILPFISERKKRIAELLQTYKLKGKHLDADSIIKINSVHNPKLIAHIQSFKPDIIVINGTRILRKNLLSNISCPIVNIHVGITPKYRGVHGGYWAVRNNDLSLFGVTLHQVDSGIDTGKIIAQSVVHPTANDNFKTYPLLQYCEGLHLLQQHFYSIIDRQIEPTSPLTSESKLHYHPTAIEYLLGKK